MRAQHRKIVKPAATSTVVEPAPVATKPADPQPIKLPDIELRVTPQDLWFYATALFLTPWGGGEQRVLGLRHLHKTLKLDKVDRDVLPTSQPLTPVEIVKLSHYHVELLIRVICGEGSNKAFDGIAGPMMSDVVSKLREAVMATAKTAVKAELEKRTK